LLKLMQPIIQICIMSLFQIYTTNRNTQSWCELALEWHS
jgi:hypothetical protein